MATRSNSGKNNNTKRKTSTKKSNTRSTNTRSTRSSSAPKYREPEPLDDSLKQEIILILIVAACFVLFLCNFDNLMGVFGAFVKKIMFGIFGFVSYVLPICAIVFTLFRIFNRDNPVVTRKLVAATVLFLIAMMICDMATGRVGETEKYDFVSIYQRCSSEFKGGGILGGSFAYLITKALGYTGAWMLIIVLALICIILITGRSIFGGIREQGQMIYDSSREEHISRSKEREIRRKERQETAQRRLDEKENRNREREERRLREQEIEENNRIIKMDREPVKGVSYNTTLQREATETEIISSARDDVHTITVSDEDVYSKKKENSAVAHINNISEGSDATREITPDYSEYDDSAWQYSEPAVEEHPGHTIEIADKPTSDITPRYKESETTYQAPVRMNGRTYGADPAAYGEGGQKPEASYSTEYGNTMGRTGSSNRVLAAKTEDTSKSGTRENAPRKASPSASYKFPPIDLLSKGKSSNGNSGERELRETSEKLQQTLETFGVKVKITEISRGPSVTRYEMQPELGVKVSKIVGLADDIKLSLAATDIRIEAPIPGKSAVGIEVPNKENEAVAFRDLIESKEFKGSTASLPFAVGKDIGGSNIIHDIAKMPHVLIAGATGSGKSVCINTIIMSILYKCHPDDVRLIMVDPKVVELNVYNGIPHLLLPVVTDPKKASEALKWAVAEMTRRYQLFADASVRDLKGYNESVEDKSLKLPHILIIVDELADLMMVAPGEVEESICRLAQLARACGIHLVIATQRPSVDVITGLIKANMPSRVAFAVSSGVDSRTILDMVGAEKLLGKGDMLFYPQGLPKPSRVQGAFVPDSDVTKVVGFLKAQNYVPGTQNDVEEQMNNMPQNSGTGGSNSDGDGGLDYDELFAKAGRFIIDKDKASIGALQRLLKIGFNRAARIMDQLAEAGVVGEEQGTKPREILMDVDQFESLLEELGLY